MGIKEIFEKLRPKSINNSDKPKMSPDELELLSYEKEDNKDAIRKKLFAKRLEKSNKFLSGKAFNLDPIPNMSSRKKVEGEIIKAETDRVKREAYFEEQKRLAKLLGKKQATKSLKNKKLRNKELKAIKKLLSQTKKAKINPKRLDDLFIVKSKGRLISNKPKPIGSIFSNSNSKPTGNILQSSNNNTQKSGNIMKSKSIFFR